MTPNTQGKIRIDWLIIPNKNGQRYVMPYRVIVDNILINTRNGDPIMHDITTDMNGFMRLK